MLRFKVILGNIREKYGKSTTYALAFSPIVIIYVFFLRSAMNNSALFSAFVWLADIIIFGFPLGFFIAYRVGHGVGSTFGDAVFYPKKYLKTAPDILSPIKGMIKREEYDEALARLNELLDEKPFRPEPYSIMAELYANELNDHLRAMELIENYFKREKVDIFDENIEMILLYADICQEHSYLKKAEQLLTREVKRKYPELKRQRLETRLEALEELKS